MSHCRVFSYFRMVVIVAQTPKKCFSLVDIHCYYYQNQKKNACTYALQRKGSLYQVIQTEMSLPKKHCG